MKVRFLTDKHMVRVYLSKKVISQGLGQERFEKTNFMDFAALFDVMEACELVNIKMVRWMERQQAMIILQLCVKTQSGPQARRLLKKK